MMAKSNMNQDILKVLLSEEQLHQRIQEMGDELFEKFRDKDPMFVGVLNGCFVFMADLVRAAQLKSEVEFISVSSYKNATKSSGVVEITRDLQRDITGRPLWPTCLGLRCRTSLWWALAWTTASSTAICPISAC